MYLNWNDPKLKELKVIVEKCTSDLNRVRKEMDACYSGLDNLRREVARYEETDLNGGEPSSGTVGQLSFRSTDTVSRSAGGQNDT